MKVFKLFSDLISCYICTPSQAHIYWPIECLDEFAEQDHFVWNNQNGENPLHGQKCLDTPKGDNHETPHRTLRARLNWNQ